MSADSDVEADIIENFAEVMEGLSKDLKELYLYRDLFFENHPLELATIKHKLVEEKKKVLIEKLESIDDGQIPFSYRAQFLFMKGRCYNISPTYDARASQCLSKAVKLNPHLVDAWNELGECYWKNLNIKEAEASFEAALNHERNPLALRSLSIILRQESGNKKPKVLSKAIVRSVELAKEAVAQDIKDGVSWTVLGNAYLCQFFMVSQDPAMLKLCKSAYKQAWLDPVAKGQPDLYYNKGIALKYEESYSEALENFEYACRLDPQWEPPRMELNKLKAYLTAGDDLVRTKGKVKPKRLTQMLQSLDTKMLGVYGTGEDHLELAHFDELHEGINAGKVVLGRVVGSIYSENAVPFTFALCDGRLQCALVTVYNWADGRGAIIGDAVALPEPSLATHTHHSALAKYNFKSIRVKNPMWLLLNGKQVGRNQLACTRVTSTYEIH